MHNPYKSIFWGGAVAGVLSLSATLIFWYFRGIRSSLVLQSIASGLLSDIAFMGGSTTAVIGALLHFVIAFGVATVYCLLAHKLSFMNRQYFIAGPIYGIVIYLISTMIILPLSEFPKA